MKMCTPRVCRARLPSGCVCIGGTGEHRRRRLNGSSFNLTDTRRCTVARARAFLVVRVQYSINTSSREFACRFRDVFGVRACVSTRTQDNGC